MRPLQAGLHYTTRLNLFDTPSKQAYKKLTTPVKEDYKGGERGRGSPDENQPVSDMRHDNSAEGDVKVVAAGLRWECQLLTTRPTEERIPIQEETP